MHSSELSRILSVAHHEELIAEANRQRALNKIERVRLTPSFWQRIQSMFNNVADAAGNATSTLKTEN